MAAQQNKVRAMAGIKQLREILGISQSALAESVGTSQPQIKRLEAGERKLTKEWAERIAPHLQTTPEQLLFGAEETQADTVTPMNHRLLLETPNAIIGDQLTAPGPSIPVFGQAVGGVDGEFVMNGTVLFEVMAPPTLSGISGAYAVTISGESMSPRYEDGEICFVDPSRRPRRGDYVVVQMQMDENGPLLAYVKKFIRHNSEELVLEQFNPAKELRFSAKNAHSVHVIVMAGFA